MVVMFRATNSKYFYKLKPKVKTKDYKIKQPDMSRQQSRYTDILNLFDRHFLKEQNKHKKSLQQFESHQVLNLLLLGKQPGLYATDLTFSIHISPRKRNLQQASFKLIAQPFNKINCDIYKILNNRWHAFNCKPQFLDNEQANDVDAYSPAFYFGDEFNNFILEKSYKKDYYHHCEVIKITKWRLKIVNIGATGWYGPSIEAIDYKIERDKIVENIKNVSNLIYQPWMKLWMENMRMIDIRNAKKNETAPSLTVSLLYFNQFDKVAPKHKPNILTVDITKKVLKHAKDSNPHLIIFGEFEGLGCLQNPIKKPEAIHKEVAITTREQYEMFFKKTDKQGDKTEQNKDLNAYPSKAQRQNLLWSSSQDEDEPANPIISIIDEQSDESNQSEDLLRNFYVKQFDRIMKW